VDEAVEAVVVTDCWIRIGEWWMLSNRGFHHVAVVSRRHLSVRCVMNTCLVSKLPYRSWGAVEAYQGVVG
jgi:hypothetical protein